MNSVNLIGRLTRDPDVKYTTGSEPMAVARFSIAIDRYEKNGEQKADFPTIVCFGKTAENCERYIHKGSQVGIEGRIQTGSYTNKDGVKVYTTDVIAKKVEFLSKAEPAQEPAQEQQITGFTKMDDDETVPF